MSWRVSITLEAAFCIEALEDALARHGRPEIFNTDQGSQLGLKWSSQRLSGGQLRWRVGDVRTGVFGAS